MVYDYYQSWQESTGYTVFLFEQEPTDWLNKSGFLKEKDEEFELKTKESQEIVNSQLIEFLDEWRQDAPSRYRKAKDAICYWINDEWYGFESPM